MKQHESEAAEKQQEIIHLMAPTKKYDAKHPRQILVTDALIEFVAEDLIPLSVVDSSRFKKLVSTLEPKYQMPSRKYLSGALLKNKHAAVKREVLDRIKKCKSVNITVDMWSNRQMKSFLGMTGH